jgi:hypothetical protein
VAHESDYAYSLMDAMELYHTIDTPHFKTSLVKGTT